MSSEAIEYYTPPKEGSLGIYAVAYFCSHDFERIAILAASYPPILKQLAAEKRVGAAIREDFITITGILVDTYNWPGASVRTLMSHCPAQELPYCLVFFKENLLTIVEGLEAKGLDKTIADKILALGRVERPCAKPHIALSNSNALVIS